METKTYMDYMYKVNENNEVSILKYTGECEEVNIPKSIDGMPVTEINASLIANTGFCNSDLLKRVIIPDGVRRIAMYSFSYSKSLESVTIPASVTEIHPSAFNRSNSLVSINVDDNNPAYADIDGVLFSKDKTKLIWFPVGKSSEAESAYTVPGGVTTIGIGAFSGCFLNKIVLPDSVTDIGSRAFDGCSKLKDVMLPAGLESISRSVFEGCASLQAIYIPESVTEIGNEAFKGCVSLQDFPVPVGVGQIRFSAFEGCTSLTRFTIPNGVKKIENKTFLNCTSLTSISIPESTTKIDLSAFSGCDSLVNITVDENNTEYTSLGGALHRKSDNKLIYKPRALLLQRASTITSVDDLAGMTDEELLADVCEELGFGCEIQADEGWECAESMFEWIHRDFIGFHMKINAFTENRRITKLCFSGLGIQKLPIAVAGLSALTVLDISHTNVEELP